MTQETLNQAVAEATGEDICTIASRGFSTIGELDLNDDDRSPLVVDWDELDLERYLSMCG